MALMTEPIKMNPEVKAEWLAALRSGEYEQGNGVLRTVDDRFCCLGVLCDLAAKAGVIDAPGDDHLVEQDIYDTAIGNYVKTRVYGYGPEKSWNDRGHPDETYRETAYLPEKVAEWAGVPRYGDRYWEPVKEDPKDSFAGLNDTGHTFQQIAAIIEAEY